MEFEPAPGFDPNVPSIARFYDYLLGGKDNYPSDRAVGDIFIRRFPGAAQLALDNRACMVRAVTVMAGELGVSQFLDLGSGLPAADNVHQVAQRLNPAARVVYVDNDPQVLAHGRALLAENASIAVISADIRSPGQLLAHQEVTAMLDFGRPVGVIASAILHYILDAEHPGGIIAAVREAMPAGSYLFISCFRTLHDARSRQLEEVLLQAFGRGKWRTNEEITAYFGDMRLLEPGLVPCARWRPDSGTDAMTESEPSEPNPYQELIVAGLAAK